MKLLHAVLKTNWPADKGVAYQAILILPLGINSKNARRGKRFIVLNPAAENLSAVVMSTRAEKFTNYFALVFSGELKTLQSFVQTLDSYEDRWHDETQRSLSEKVRDMAETQFHLSLEYRGAP